MIILDGHKLGWHSSRVKGWKMGDNVVPITIDIALTTQCNYQCIYCYGQLQRINSGKPIPREAVMSFLDDAKEIGVKGISFIGDGESTCSPYLYDAIRHAHSIGLDVALGTNGFALNDELLPEILPMLTYLRFNISAGYPSSYARVHGTTHKAFFKVKKTIRKAVQVKNNLGLKTTIGMQMVLLPELRHEILALTKAGASLGVDYLVIKHCSDDENGTLGVDYSAYDESLKNIIRRAETYAGEGKNPNYKVIAKWSKINSEGKRSYSQCNGARFILQISGSGLVAPCGMFFNDKYDQYHIGNITETRFKDIFNSDRYREVMDFIASDKFDAKKDCGTLCLQHCCNEYLDGINKGNKIVVEKGDPPEHINFV